MDPIKKASVYTLYETVYLFHGEHFGQFESYLRRLKQLGRVDLEIIFSRRSFISSLR